MKKLLLFILTVAVGAWLVAQNAATPKPLAELTPAGALLYLEAKNLSALLSDWNTSAEKKNWLSSGNYQVFSRSRLYLRLQQTFEEYSETMGLPPDMTLLNSVAGGESALAIYDISNLEFVYLTRLPSARAMESALWKMKEKFQARTAAGTPYYVKTGGKPARTACFSIAGDLLILATREEALTGALALISGANATPVRREAWFEQAARATGAPGDLRMALNMEKLVRNPSFRSYWVQRNNSELRPFFAGMNDLVRTSGEVREERVLLRQEPVTAPDPNVVGGLLRLAQNAGLYRAWSQPEPSMVADLITRKVLWPGPVTTAESRVAPNASLDAAEIGSESDLETRIDAAPYQPPGLVFRTEAMQSLLTKQRPQAALHLQSGRRAADGVFVTNDSAIAVQAASDWDAAAVRDAIQKAVEGLYTTAKLGVQWRERQGFWELDGLAPVVMATRGRLLIISNRAEYLAAILPLATQTGGQQSIIYAAGYRSAGELANYTRIMQFIETPQGEGNGEPPLFSSNLASLARTLRRVQSTAIVSRDDGRMVKQTVTYRLGQ